MLPDEPGPPAPPGPPRDPEPPRHPEQPRDPDPPLDPVPPRIPEQPVDCLPCDCFGGGWDPYLLAGAAGAVAALAVCLAVAGLIVVVRYIGQYLFYAALILLLLSGLYLYLRRPEDARRFRRYLAGRGREAISRLWGWVVQPPEVFMFAFKLGQLLEYALKLGVMYKLYCFSYLKTYSILLR